MAAQSLKFPEAAGLGLENGGRGADSIGWPIALILFGMVMIGLSALALRIDRDYVRASSKHPA